VHKKSYTFSKHYPIADALGGAALAEHPADALRQALRGDLEVLICTPESFLRASAALGWAHRQRPFALVAIDEAATVTSTWEFRSSHGALAPQLREWLSNVPRMALSASLTPEMLAGAVLPTAPRLHLHHEPRRNLEAHVALGGTANKQKHKKNIKKRKREGRAREPVSW
jgi:superfamily II DNA helicase RecQ